MNKLYFILANGLDPGLNEFDKESYLAYLSCRSCSEERLSLHLILLTGLGFVSFLNKGISFALY